MQGWRKRMEDSHITDVGRGESGTLNVFGVFDGHGGKEIAQFVSRHFTEELLNNPSYKGKNLIMALQETFLQMDVIMQNKKGKEEIRTLAKLSKEEDDIQSKKEPQNSQMQMLSQLMNAKSAESDDVSMRTGCTSSIFVIDENERVMYFANAGDSRSVLCKNGTAIAMSIDHKPELETEKNRIYKANGWITEGRVNGNLNLTRGFGDLEYKQNKTIPPEEQIITAHPDIRSASLTPETDFVILGCDGIWDCLTNQEACDFVKVRMQKEPERKLSSIIEEMMDEIVAKDLYNETGVGCDNMTCMVICFKKK